MATQEETQKIFEVIEQALLSLCREKPNDPVDYLSRKMLELIGDDPNSAIRKKTTLIEGEVKDNIVLSAEKIAIQNLKKDFYQNYKIIEDISLNNYLIEDLKLLNVYFNVLDKIINLYKPELYYKFTDSYIKTNFYSLFLSFLLLSKFLFFYCHLLFSFLRHLLFLH